jgi:hypothetical protein
MGTSRVIDRFLEQPNSRWRKFRLWLWVTGLDVRDWCLRWIYAQHNARVIIDFENRMSAVICEASGHLMSKPYYTAEAMLAQIHEHQQQFYAEGYADGRKDVAEAFGLDLDRKCRVCGCSEDNACVADGKPCAWAASDLCTACVGKDPAAVALEDVPY